MRNSFLFLFIICSFFACKKNEGTVSIETLSGKWTTGGYDFIMYNASGAVVSHMVADAIKTYWTFDQTHLRLSNDINLDVKTSGYKVINRSGVRTLDIANAEVATYTSWTIDEESSNRLLISSQITDKKQLNYGQNQTAARGVKIIYLSK